MTTTSAQTFLHESTSTRTKRWRVACVFALSLGAFLALGVAVRPQPALALPSNGVGGSCVYCDCTLQFSLYDAIYKCDCPDSTFVGGRICDIRYSPFNGTETCKVTGLCSPIFGSGGGGSTYLP
jgi:hypothetical protein